MNPAGNSRPHQPPAPRGQVEVDALVAKYAPIGRRLRRERLLRWGALALALPVAAVLGTLAWRSAQQPATVPQVAAAAPAADSAARVESALAEFRELRDQVSAETGALATQRAELARQRERFEERGAQLIRQIETINAQGASLAGRLQQFESERARLEATLAKVEGQQRALETRQARAGQAAPNLEQQLAEIARQRTRLQEQQAQVRDQGEMLAREIDRINSQRQELERQREAIQQQREEVQALLNQIREVGLNRLRERRDEAVAVAKAEKRAKPAGALATVAAVDSNVLGGMRGGLNVGGDFAISIGVTRTGSVNGVEQFTNAMYIGDLTKVNAGALVNVDPAVIQTGAGNVITTDLAGSTAQNVTTIIQNSLDNQSLATQTIMDVSLQNVSAITQGISASDAVSDSLSMQR